jgi:hypothetical protein
MRGGADFSMDGTYRYHLTRTWDMEGSRVVFIGLNPSTADAMKDDPTIRRCIGFAKSWYFGRMEMLNLFAYRCTASDYLHRVKDPIGPDNDAVIKQVCHDALLVIVAWGAHPMAQERGAEVCGMLGHRRIHCLGHSRHLAPRHPLYMPKKAKPIQYQGR